MNKAMKQGLENKFKLTSTIRTTNMHLFDSDGKIRKYDTPEKILEEFFKLRLGFYEKRKKALLDNIELHFTKLDNKVRFIRCIGDGDIKVSNRTSDYEYLFSMPIGTLTTEMIVDLVTERYELNNEMEKIRQTSPRSLWLRDLDVFDRELDVLDQMGAEAEEKRRLMREKKGRNGVAFKAAPKRQPKRTAANWHASEPVVTKRLVPQKKPANKASASTDDIPELKEAFNINESTSDHSGMEIESVKEHQKGKRGRKELTNSGAAKAAASSLVPIALLPILKVVSTATIQSPNSVFPLFRMADLQRLPIPSVVDGLTPDQRKILFCAFKRNLIKETRVSQFAGYVVKHSACRQGKESVGDTIIKMAHAFVGSNNINLFYPSGPSGSRYQGGTDCASSDYILTKLSPITRTIFPKDDDDLLDYLHEDGQSVEPIWYVPIIPMVLVNGYKIAGADEVSICIPNYSPRDILANLRRLLNDDCTEPMHPWYRRFKGSIEKTRKKTSGVMYTVTGIIEAVDSTTLRITELPIHCWTQDYQRFLDGLLMEGFIQEYMMQGNANDVDFVVNLSEENMRETKQKELEKKFYLTATIGTRNVRLLAQMKVLLENLESALKKLDNKVRFIRGVVECDISVGNRKKKDLIMELQRKCFDPLPTKLKTTEPTAGKGENASSYEYLLSMPISTLTVEKMQELITAKVKLENEVEKQRQTSPRSLWLSNLDAFEKELDLLDQMDTEATKRTFMRENNARKGVASKAEPKRKPKKTAAKSQKVENATTDNEVCSSVSGNAAQPVVTKRLVPRKKPVNKVLQASALMTDDPEDVVPEPKKCLEAFDIIDSPSDHSGMEIEVVQQHQKGKRGRKEPSKRGAAKEILSFPSL
ncbi:hypothetical protein EJB05_19629 [Eragrostis curvula]|uniref:DNA topoisomerase (ATP-hydrolyzing) n=1 Tax=Eragrostis curvula TaxID=38414 RepID=A0A5J9UYJ7_9POAL|nr:hypothetical protein EJB05_19629 [Eragrostis curvula]